MFLSVIIPTRNRANSLYFALNSLRRQTLSIFDFETIIIDNGSTDKTKEVVIGFQDQIKNLRYFHEPSPGLHAGRNLGSHYAQAEILVFADDDIEAFPTWLQAVKESFNDEETLLVGGKCLPKFECDPSDWIQTMWKSDAKGHRCLAYLSIINLGDESKVISPFHVFGCNFAIRRSVLVEAGGFHPDGMPQELIRFRGDGESHVSRYIQDRGYKTVYNPLASVYHQVPKNRMTIQYFSQRAYNQGISDSYTTIRKNGGLEAAQDLISTHEEKKAQRKLLNIYQRVRRKSLVEIPGAVYRHAKRKIFPRTNKVSSTVSENTNDPIIELRQQIFAAYRAGYSYHQDEVRKDPELLKWVLRPNYWNYRLPSKSNSQYLITDNQ